MDNSSCVGSDTPGSRNGVGVSGGIVSLHFKPRVGGAMGF